MKARQILLGSLLLVALLAISSGLLTTFGMAKVMPALASSTSKSNPISLPLLKPLGLDSPATNYLHIFDGTWLSGCDLYIPAGTNLSNLASYSRCGYGNWDNAISSFTIQSGAWVTFYVDTNYGGSSVSYVGPDGLGVMPSGFNDSILSLQVGWVAAHAQ